MTTVPNQLDAKAFDGQIYSGSWRGAHGGDTANVEPATGNELGRTGVADAENVARACATANAVQREWAATSFERRAAVMRRAGALVEQHADSESGLSLSILTKDVMRGLALAEQIPTGIAHINDQTMNDEAVAPFGGVLESGTGTRSGGAANLDAFTDQRWITLRGEIPPYPF